VGVLSGLACQAGDGVAADADEPAGLSGAVALGQVTENGTGLVLGEMGAEQRGPLAFGEPVFTGPAVEQADMVLLAKMAADGEVASVTAAVERAVGTLAAEASEVVHGPGRIGPCPSDGVRK
jgi:hypothetical protein